MGFDRLKTKLLLDSNKKVAVGLAHVPLEELQELKDWLYSRGIQYEHRTHKANGAKLPYNGVLLIGLKQ